MSYKTIKFSIEGRAPLMMHNGVLCDPTNDFVREIKKITAKRTKQTDEDKIYLSELEFKGGLYVDQKGEPCVPSVNIESCIRDGARQTSKGKVVQSGLFVESDAPLKYRGPRNADELFADSKFVDRRPAGVQKSKVMRTRPIFRDWSLEFEVCYLPDICNRDDVIAWVETAGAIKGLGDFRPKYGRFEVVSAK